MVDVKKKHKGQEHYYILDNGSRPSIVYFSKTMVYVYRVPLDVWYVTEEEEEADYTELVFKIRFLKKFIGDDKRYPSAYKGNSILVKTGRNTYIFIGSEIYSFQTTDSIIKYYSYVEEFDMDSYPVALGKDNVYFIARKKYISRDDIDPTFTDWNNAYFDIYDSKEFDPKKMKGVKMIKSGWWW